MDRDEAARSGTPAAAAAPPSPPPPPPEKELPASSTSSDRISSRGSMSREAERSLSPSPDASQERASASSASRAASASNEKSPSSSPSSSQNALVLLFRPVLPRVGAATLALQRLWSWEPAERERERVGRVTLFGRSVFFFGFRSRASEGGERLDWKFFFRHCFLFSLSFALSLLSISVLPWAQHRGPYQPVAGAREDVGGEGAGEHGGHRHFVHGRIGNDGVSAALHRASEALLLPISCSLQQRNVKHLCHRGE